MYSVNLMGVLFQIVRQRETAEDLLQECFLKINCNFHTYDEKKARLFTWMLTLTRHAAIDYLMKRSSQNMKNTLEIDGIMDDIQERFSYSINTDIIGIKKLLSSLPSKQRLLIEMIYYQGFTHAEVADQLHMPLGSVKSALRTAILHLRRVFATDQRLAA